MTIDEWKHPHAHNQELGTLIRVTQDDKQWYEVIKYSVTEEQGNTNVL